MDHSFTRRLTRHAVIGGSILCFLFDMTGASQAGNAPVPVIGPAVHSAPPTPPIVQRTLPEPGQPQPKPLGVTPYSIGQPTDEEQLYLEYLNRFRANPVAESQRLATTTDPNVVSAYNGLGVDLNLMVSEFATNPAVPPLAMNAKLTAAARWHSGDMFTNQYQGHFQTNGAIVLSPGDRILTNGYNYSTYGENVFSYADSVFQGHAAFAVDWGPGPGGMQNPPGHRENMLSPSFREAGIGVFDGVNGTVGPQLVTQDLGTQGSSPVYISGVVYFDLAGKNFYDLGEGIGGVMVNTPGSAYFALTADSGGYAIPVTSNGTYKLTFTAAGLSNQVTATVTTLHNTKVDLAPVYVPPAISGPNPASLNQNNTYTFTAVPAATAYQWEQAELVPYTLVEGAENGTANLTVTSSGYSVISTDMAASGTRSFNLFHAAPVDQVITLNPIVFVNANSVLSFSKSVGYSLSNEVAEAQVSVDGGQNWLTVWSEPGNDGNSSVDSAFVPESIPLTAYAGQSLQVRFVYAYNGGIYFNSGSGLGLYLDDIAISNAGQLSGTTTNSVPSGRSFSFVPTDLTNYILRVRAQMNSRTLPWGPIFTASVSPAAGSPGIQVTGPAVVLGSQFQIDFTVTNFRTGMSFQLLRTSDLGGTWAPDASASLQTLAPNSKFRFTTSTTAGTKAFFRIQGN